MVMTEWKRARLAGLLSRGNAAINKAGPSSRPTPSALPTTFLASPAQFTPTAASPQPIPNTSSPHPAADPFQPQTVSAPTSPTPIVAIPLATFRASPSPTPLEKNKGVVLIPYDEDEDSMDGPVFKRMRTTAVATSHSSSDRRLASLRDNPPSASSPPRPLTLEEGAETVHEHSPTPASEHPRVIQHILRGVQLKALGNLDDRALPENMALSLGEFLARASFSSYQVEARAKERQVLTSELAQAKEQMVAQAQRFFI